MRADSADIGLTRGEKKKAIATRELPLAADFNALQLKDRAASALFSLFNGRTNSANA